MGWMVPGVVSVEKFADNFRKLGYDVRVTLSDGKEVYIEVKTTSSNGEIVAIEEGEREHNQDSGCKHEHVLFVISDIKTTMVNEDWQCWGGNPAIVPNWKIATSDLTEQPSWLYKVPQTSSATVV